MEIIFEPDEITRYYAYGDPNMRWDTWHIEINGGSVARLVVARALDVLKPYQERPAIVPRWDATTTSRKNTPSHPYVDSVRVEDDWRRKGLATLLYRRAASDLAELGLRLRSGGLNDNSRALWESFVKQGLAKREGRSYFWVG